MGERRSSCCGTMGSAMYLQHWDAGSIPGLTQCIKNPGLLQMCSPPLQLGSHPWLGNSICCGVEKKEKKKMGERRQKQKYRDGCWCAVLSVAPPIGPGVGMIISKFLHEGTYYIDPLSSHVLQQKCRAALQPLGCSFSIFRLKLGHKVMTHYNIMY